MGGPRSPQTLVHEGIYAIKVSMKTHLTPTASLYIAGLSARTIHALRVHLVCSRVRHLATAHTATAMAGKRQLADLTHLQLRSFIETWACH